VAVGNVLLAPETATLVHVTVGDEANAWALFQARRDKKYSFVDCTSFVLMRRLKIEKAVALDQDFAREGFELLS